MPKKKEFSIIVAKKLQIGIPQKRVVGNYPFLGEGGRIMEKIRLTQMTKAAG
ncbi:MAG: hypothetical protein GX349_00865 [Firmicutes bacterium]|nr:hypothetical protein [Bacillota bacterium]